MTIPAVPDASKGRFHFLVVPEHSATEAAPIWRTCADELVFLTELYSQLLETRAGWCFLIVDGQRANLCLPEQSFRVVMPDGREITSSGKKELVSQDGRFKILELAR